MSEFEITSRQRATITRAVNSLNKARRELEVANPEAPNVNWYLEDSNNLNLMSDDSHTGHNGGANIDAVMETWNLERASGGGW